MSIPQRIAASTALSRQAHYTGTLALSRLPRLREAVAQAGDDDALQVEVSALRDAQHQAHLQLRVQGSVTLVCQRCLEPYAQALDIDTDLRLVQSEAEEERLLQVCEPYLVENDELPLQQLVEDEVLLALPAVPRCARDACLAQHGG